MISGQLDKLYRHFLHNADIDKYHGDIEVLAGLLRWETPQLINAMKLVEQAYPIKVFWFSSTLFIVELFPLPPGTQSRLLRSDIVE